VLEEATDESAGRKRHHAPLSVTWALASSALKDGKTNPTLTPCCGIPGLIGAQKDAKEQS